MTKAIPPATVTGWQAGVALEQPTRLELGSLRPRLAPGLSAAGLAFPAPEFPATGRSARILLCKGLAQVPAAQDRRGSPSPP